MPWHPHQSVRLSDRLSLSMDLADGHLDLSADDMSIPGRGLALTVRHTWDSTAASGLSTTAGTGWSLNVGLSMGGGLTGTLTYTDATGAVWAFPYTGSPSAPGPYTSYRTPPGLPWQLAASTAGYTLTDILSGETLTFNAQGQYLADTDSYGNANTLSYSQGLPEDLSNSGGRDICLPYTASGLLSDAESPLWMSSGGTQGQHVSYRYDGRRQLTALTWGAGTSDAITATFGYSGTQLVTVTTPYTQSPHSWSIGYDPFGRVSTLTSPVSGTVGQTGYTPAYTTTLSYAPGWAQAVQGTGTSAALTTTYTLDAQGEATRITDGLGHSTSSSYDADHDVTSSTDANGNTTTNAYQYVGASGSTGLVTQTVQPPIAPYAPGNPSYTPIVTTHRYDPSTYDLLETDLPEGGKTLYGYDGHHGLITTTTALNSAGTLWRGTVNLLDGYGELTGTVDGRGVTVTGSGVATLNPALAPLYTRSLTYDAQGDQVSAGTPPLTTTLNGYTATAPATTTSAFDGDGNRTASESANGAGTVSSYDHLGRLVQTLQPAVALWTAPLTTTPTIAINSAGAATGAFVADTDYSGGSTDSVNNAIDTRGVANPAPQGVYQTQRYGTFSYTVPNLTPGGAYRVRLHFAESYVSGPGQRLFTVTLDGNPVLTSFDVYAAAGGANRAVVEEFPAIASSSGQITLGYTTVLRSAESMGIEIIPATPLVQTTRYDGEGNVVSATDANGDVSTTSYDPLGRQVTQTNPVNGTSVMTYSATNLAASQDPLGNVTSYGYDVAGRVITTSAPVSGTTQYQYDAAGNTVAITQADRSSGTPIQIELRTFDALNRVISDTVTGPAGPSLTTQTAYDKDGNVAQVEQPNGDVTYNTYDAADQLTAVEIDSAPISGPGSATHPKYEAYSYDAAGNTLQSVDADNRTTTTTYDGDNRVLQTIAVSYAPTGTTTITTTAGYDPDGNTVLQTTQTSNTTNPGQVQTHTYSSTYNAADWETSTTDDGLTTNYAYDAAGQQRTQTIIDGITPVTTQLDAEGRATSISEGYGGAGPYTALFGYNANNEVVTMTMPGSVQETAQYDPDSRVTQVAAMGPNMGTITNTLASTYTYGYNAIGWITSTTTLSV